MKTSSKRKATIILLCFIGGCVLLWCAAAWLRAQEPKAFISAPEQYVGVIVEDLSSEVYSYKVQIPARRILDSINGCYAQEDAYPESAQPLFRFIFASRCGYGEAGSIGTDAQLCVMEVYEDGFCIPSNETFYRCDWDIYAWCVSLYEHLDSDTYYGDIYAYDADTGEYSIWTL